MPPYDEPTDDELWGVYTRHRSARRPEARALDEPSDDELLYAYNNRGRWWDTLATGTLRVGGGVLGGVLGGLAATPETLGVGTIPGAVLGGGAGAALGDELAQGYEQWRGLRKGFNWKQTAAEGAIGAIPMGKAAGGLRGILGMGAKGAGLAAAGTVGQHWADSDVGIPTSRRDIEKILPSGQELALSGGLGFLLGAGAEGVAQRLARRATAGAAAGTDASPGGGAAARLPEGVEQFERDVTRPPVTDPEREIPGFYRYDEPADALPDNVQWWQIEREIADRTANPPSAARNRAAYFERDREIQAQLELERAWQARTEDVITDRASGFDPLGAADDVTRDAAQAQAEHFRSQGLARYFDADAAIQAEVAGGRRMVEDAAANVIPPERQLAEGTRFYSGPGGTADMRALPKRQPVGPDALTTVDGRSAFTDALERAGGSSARGNLWDRIRARAIQEGYRGGDQELWELFQRNMRSVRGYDSILRNGLYRVRRGLASAPAPTSAESLAEVAAGPNFWRAIQPEGAVDDAARAAAGEAPAAAGAADDFAVPSWVDEVDEAVPPPAAGAREPGIEGFVKPELVGAIAGAGTGAAAGAATGDTPQERVERGVLGGLAGLLGVPFAMSMARRGIRADPAAAATIKALEQQGEVMQFKRGEGEVPLRSINTPTGPMGPASARAGDRVYQIPKEARTPIPAAAEMSDARRYNLRLDKLPESTRQPIADLLLANQGYDVQRRGVQPMARTAALAERIKIDLQKALKPGEIVNAETQYAYANALVNITDRADKVRQKIAEDASKGITNADDAGELAKLTGDMHVLLASVMGSRAETGRALNMQKMLRRLQPSEIRMVGDLMARGKLKAHLGKVSELLEAMRGKTPEEQYELLRGARNTTFSEKATSYFMANILSGVETQVRNVLGNASSTASHMALKPVAGGYDALKSMLTGKGRTIYGREGIENLKGTIAGFDTAFRDAWYTLQHGFSAQQLQEQVANLDEIVAPRMEFKGGGANPFNWAGRGLEGMDRFFVQLNRSAEMFGRSYAMARGELEKAGMKPGSKAFDDALAKRIAELRLNPPEALGRQVDKAATEMAFREDPGKLANLVILGKHQVPALNYVFPFVRTVSNIMRQGYEWTPLSLAVKGGKAALGNENAWVRGLPKDAAPEEVARAATEMQAKGLAGTVALLPLAWMAATGRLSGNGPADRAERAQLMESGWRPNSVKIGDHWFSYTLAQPLAVPAAILGNGFEAARDVQKQATKSGGAAQAESIMGQTLARAANSALDQSYLQGVTTIVDALNDPRYAGEKFVEQMARGFTPLSGFLRSATKAVDPYIRDPETLAESIAAGIPGLSSTVKPRLSRYGEPIERERGGGLAWRTGEAINPLNISRATEDPIDQELARLGVTVGTPTDRVSVKDLTGQRVKLEPDVAFDVRQARGRAARVALARILRAPGYRSMPDHVKQRVIEDVLSKATRGVSSAIRGEVRGGREGLVRMLNQRLEPQARETY